MKLALFLTLSLTTFTAVAKKVDTSKMTFEEAKKHRLEKITSRQARLEKTKSCVEAAKDKEGLKACGREHRKMKP